ncbi:MAG: GNAT family N-acetyltransferase [Ferrovibrio sp.]|uniref:GNAT family N-acetyltransferase n=1 Tax=Ferrovibrio sp. TaxID=1917215 RepID=UPI00391CEFB8
MTYAIRSARPDEAGLLREIERAAAQAFSAVGYPALATGEPTAAEEFRAAAAEGMLAVAVGNNDRPVGFLLAAELDACLYVQELDVHPDHAGHRLAVRLFEAADAMARQRHLRALTLTTFRHVPWNAPYYARLGFVPMTAAGIGPDLRMVIERQRAAGLDMANRVAMRRPVSS